MNGFEYRAIGPAPKGIFRVMAAFFIVLLFAACSMAKQVRTLAVEGGFRGPGDSWANAKVFRFTIYDAAGNQTQSHQAPTGWVDYLEKACPVYARQAF
jgi:hypothetical protein